MKYIAVLTNTTIKKLKGYVIFEEDKVNKELKLVLILLVYRKKTWFIFIIR